VDFPISATLSNLKSLKRICNKDDIITIVGGGNMGDLYGDIELLRLMIVKSFPKNKIISFPQTIEYVDPVKNKFLLKLSQSVYQGHKHLLMCARESVSYSKMKELYPRCQICLVPDIVMTLDMHSKIVERDPKLITLCLRNDKEKNNSCVDETLLAANLYEKGFKVDHRDTHINKSKMSVEERELELLNIWEQFSRSRLVITDRLHGMIFAFITGTPAIILPNSNFKVEKCYEWISECGFIHFVNNPNNDIILENLNLQNNNDGFQRTHELILNQINKINLYFKR
jgi:pyruvyl transferase EpsI